MQALLSIASLAASRDGWGGPDDEFVATPEGFWPLRGVVVNGVRYTGNAAHEDHGERLELWKHETPGRWVDTDSVLGRRMNGNIIRYDPAISNVVYAGGTLYHLAQDYDPAQGGTGLYARDPATGEVLWSTELPEPANQIVVANGRLFVGTRNGKIYCFAPQGIEKHGTIEEDYDDAPLAIADDIATAAESILQATGLENGYILVLDCHDGQLPLALAQNSNLYICASFSDEDQLTAARLAYVQAGLHGSRIVTALVEPGGKQPWPPNFADCVVSDAALRGGPLPTNVAELVRVTKPIRGMVLLSASADNDLAAWTAATGLAEWETLEYGGTWAKWTRPPLPEAGQWNHMYGDAGNTGSSDDGALLPPLGLVWYGMPYVQGGTDQTPLITGGILLSPDAGSIEAYDQYTGRRLWRLEGQGLGQGQGRIAASDDYLFIIYDKILLQIDLATGEELGGYQTPFGPEHGWAWLAVAPDGKTVFGSGGGGLWATEMESGRGDTRWVIGGPEDSLSGHTVMDDNRILVLGNAAEGDMRAAAIEELRAWFQTQPPELLAEFESQVDRRDIRVMSCYDATNGERLWQKGVDISNCGGQWLRQVSYGSRRGYDPYAFFDMYLNNGVLVMGAQGGADKDWHMFHAGNYQNKALNAYDAETGEHLWYRFANYRARPVIVGDTIIAEPWAYDLRTGEPAQRDHPVTGQMEDWSFCRYSKQCGIFSASRYFLFGRSMGVGYHDMYSDQGFYTFWHSRASCWIDCASGGGMMIKPPQALGCGCAWNMPFTIALATVEEQPSAAPIFSQTGPTLPVRHLHLDVGGTGDRRDAAGNLWLHAETRERHPLFLNYPIHYVEYASAAPLQRSAFHTEIAGADPAFAFASAHVGLKCLVLPVTTPASGPGEYVVRLGFAAPPGDTPGSRVFTVRLNGEPVLESFDIAAEAGGVDRAVWKEFTTTLEGDLSIDLAPAVENPTYSQLPLLNAVEILRQDEPGVGLHVPEELWLGGNQREGTAVLTVENFGRQAFQGRLEVAAPEGLVIDTSALGEITLAPGEALPIELPLRAEENLPEGYNLARVRVVEAGGQEHIARDMPIEFLGPLERHIVSGDTREILLDDYRMFLYQHALPIYQRKWMPISTGGNQPGDQAASRGYLMYGVPQELAPQVRRLRVRLHVSPACTALQQASSREARRTGIAADDYGTVQRLAGPPYPEMNQLRYDEPPPTAGESVALAPVAWNENIVEASPPFTPEDLQENTQVILALEPTSLAGIAYWACEPPEQHTRVKLLVDYEPLPPEELPSE